MKNSLPLVDQVSALSWGLTDREASLFAILREIAANEEPVDFASESSGYLYPVDRDKLVLDYPLLFKTEDRVYRHLVKLAKKSLIVYEKHSRKDFIKLTAKGRTWNVAEAHKTRPSKGVPDSSKNAGQNDSLKLVKNAEFEDVESKVGENPEFTPYKEHTTLSLIGKESSVKKPSSGGPTLAELSGYLDFTTEYKKQCPGESLPSYDVISLALKWYEEKPPAMSIKLFCKFVLYWTEKNASGKKMRFQLQQVFDVRKRMFRFLNYERPGSSNSPSSGAGISDDDKRLISDVLKPK